MGKTIAVLGCCVFMVAAIHAQQVPGISAAGVSNHKWPQMRGVMSHDPNFKRTSALSFYKRKSEWRKIIDSTWGPGLPLAQKLSVFDYYSAYIRAHNPTFSYTKLNWDSVSAYWRAKITDSTSRGGFSAILSCVAGELHDGHAWAWDTVMSATPLNPGTPLLSIVSSDGIGRRDIMGAVSHFGAGLAALPDSSLLVYMVVPNHPLGLEPGDIVLGYEGVPWRTLIHELMGARLPKVQYYACSQSASAYDLLVCAGMNWHLFDTIDVVKRSSGQTLHLPTNLLLTLQPHGGLVNGAQLPVPGVAMPGWVGTTTDVFTSDGVTYGVVQGTGIGYIYVYHHCNDNVGGLFDAAVAALSNTHGLIIDLRFDIGGWSGLNSGIARLTNYAGPTLQAFERSSATDLESLVPVSWSDEYDIPQDSRSYRYPVAVLLGPECGSYGDVTAHQLTYLDHVRFFGKPPRGLFSAMGEPLYSGFTIACPAYVNTDIHSPQKQLWGQEFPLDEHVWLTPEGVAKGEDDVVKRALDWISTVSYAYRVNVNPALPRKLLDTVRVQATVENPQSRSVHATALIKDFATGKLQDSVLLHNDGQHGDGLANDSLWGGFFVPTTIGVYGVSVRTVDEVAGTTWELADAAAFATAGPVKYAGYRHWQYSDDTMFTGGGSYGLYIGLRNLGSTGVIPNATVRVTPVDPLLDVASAAPLDCGTLPPGDTVCYSSGLVAIDLGSAREKEDSAALFALNISTNGFQLWRDTMRIVVHTPTAVAEGQHAFPTCYRLEQNYPNPFNPTTVIRYQLPVASALKLAVYDPLGREVAVLVNERRDAGVHEVKFDGSKLASGVYFYRLEAGGFVQTKTMLILR